MKREKVTAWSTKYALTSGIEIVNGEICEDYPGMLSYGGMSHLHGNDWHRTPEAAIARAEEMRKAKIKSLKKSLAKLEKMAFSVPE